MKTLLLFLLSFPAVAALTFTPSTACGSTTTVASKSCLIGSVTAGNLLWVGVSWAGGGCTPSIVVTDDASNVYTQAGTDSQAGTTSVKSGIFLATALTTATVTATATNAVGTCFITVLPAIITGQATVGFLDQTPKANSTGANTITCTFTRTGNELLTVASNYNATATWTTTGSTGTFSIGANITNGACCQPGLQAYQYVTSGTTYNAVINGGGGSVGITCAGASIKEASAASFLIPQRGSSFVQ